MISHIAGGLFAISALVLCVVVAALHHNVWGIVTGAIYGATMIVLYSMSSIYHGLRHQNSKKIMQVVDHCAVFLLIAGTYTPIALVSIRAESAAWGWVLFGIVWGAALIGIILNAIDLKQFKVFSMICYIATGWSCLIVIPVAIKAIAIPALILILAGGIAYTVGAILYGLGRKHKFMHSVFHIFVVMGSVLQFFAIVLYIM